jgi:hypothetical protein
VWFSGGLHGGAVFLNIPVTDSKITIEASAFRGVGHIPGRVMARVAIALAGGVMFVVDLFLLRSAVLFFVLRGPVGLLF